MLGAFFKIKAHFKHHFCPNSPKLAQVSPNLPDNLGSHFCKFKAYTAISTDFAWIFTKSKLLEVRLHPYLLH